MSAATCGWWSRFATRSSRTASICTSTASSLRLTRGVARRLLAQAGGYHNLLSFISRNENEVIWDASDGVAGRLPTDQAVTIAFEHRGVQLLLTVDGQERVRQTDLLPITGEGLDGVAIRGSIIEGRAVIESLAVYRRSLPRKGGPVTAGDVLVKAGSLPIGQTVTLAFEHRGVQLLLTVDAGAGAADQLAAHHRRRTGGLAIRSWIHDAGAIVESLAVYRRSEPRKAGPVTIGDSLVQKGTCRRPCGGISTWPTTTPARPSGSWPWPRPAWWRRSGGAKAEGTRSVPAALRERFGREYPRSGYRESILAADAIAAWQEDHYDEAFELLDRIRAINPQARLPLRLLASAREKKDPPPKAVIARLMRKLAHAPRQPPGHPILGRRSPGRIG